MKVNVPFKNIENLTPPALIILESIVDDPLYSHLYEKTERHPLSRYNASLSLVCKRILRVIKELEKVQNERNFESKTSNWTENLLELTNHMLYALMEHVEACKKIIESFSSNSSQNASKSICKSYKNSVDSYRNHIANVVNNLKHKQNQLRIIAFYWENNSSLGYFVEGSVDDKGTLGPDPTIHSNSATAFSFYRDIPFHICNIYTVSTQLALALTKIDQRFKQLNSNSKGSSYWFELLKASSHLPHIYFEDELKKPIPLIQAKNNLIKLEFPSKTLTPMSIPKGSKIVLSLLGDGITKSWNLPYFDASKNKTID